MALVLQGHLRTATIEATETTRVLELKRDDLEGSMLFRFGARGKPSVRVVARGLARRLNLAVTTSRTSKKIWPLIKGLSSG